MKNLLLLHSLQHSQIQLSTASRNPVWLFVLPFFQGYWRQALLIALFGIGTICSAQAQVTGTIFRDFNANGIKDNANEPGVASLTVTAYFNATTATAISTTAGAYAFTAAQIPNTTKVRLEFSGIPTGDFSGPFSAAAAGNGTSVQFVTAGAAATNINFGVNLPEDFNTGSANSELYVPCYVNGDPLGGGNSGSSDWFVNFPYTNSGTTAPTRKLNGTVIGATWGVAQSKQANKVFTSAFIKRNVGLGVLGSGGIYMLTPTATSFTVSQFYDMDANGHRTRAGAGAPAYGNGSSFAISGGNNNVITYSGAVDAASGSPVGLGVMGVNGSGGRNLPAASTTPNYDPAAFGQVGKVGLGGLTISDDGQFLFVMNLYDRKLYRLELDNPTNPTSVVSVTSYALPTIACNNGILRGFAVHFYRNKVFVGTVCTGETGGQNIINGASDLTASVFELTNPTGTAAFSAAPVLTVPLNYQKGGTRALFPNAPERGVQWYPWIDNTDAGFGESTAPEVRVRPTPMLTDLTFNERGDMVLAFTDRSGHTWGWRNYRHLASSTQLHRQVIGGDLLIAGKNNTTGVFSLENNASFVSNGATVSSAGVGNGQGPGSGEFFYQDAFDPNHFETSLGAVTSLPGSAEVLATVMDPIALNSGGTTRMSIVDGAVVAGTDYQLYVDPSGTPPPTFFGKANGLGDVEIRKFVAPIEIGNRVWRDDNRNGIQDPAEVGISGVEVRVFKNNVLVATATTSADGEYYFSSGTGTNTTSALYNLTALSAGSTVELRIDQNQTELVNSPISPSNEGSNDGIDNDFALSGAGSNTVITSLTLGVSGQNKHVFDAGFATCPTIAFTAPASATTTVCANTTLNMSVTSNAVAPDQIRFVYFTEPLASAAEAYTSTEGTVLGTVNSTSVVGNKTVTLSNLLLPDNISDANIPIYVYAILVSADGLCQPVSSRVIILRPRPVASIVGEDVACTGTQTALSSLDVATTYKWSVGTNPAVVSTAQNYSPTVSTTTTYHLVISDASGCVSDAADITVDAVVCNPCVAGPGKIGGNSYRDYNGNGVKDTGEKGIAGLTVQIFVCSATGSSTLVATTTTDLNGDYFTAGLTDGRSYRVEFSNLPAGFEPTARGTNNGTTVQFVNSPTCGVSLGLNEPDTYCQANPRLATPCYVSGDASATAPVDVLVAFNYTSPTNPVKQTVANKAQMGSVWGIAYSGLRQKIYSGAFLKRHVGLGPNGLGAIYSSNVSGAANASLLVTIPNAGTIPTNAARNLAGPTVPSFDQDAFAKVGAVGLGDVDISEDEKTLYAVNLNDKKVYIVDVSTQTITGSINVPNPACSATGDYHPFALAYRRGKLYVGITCDASVSNQTADLKSFVYEMNVATNVFSATPVLTIPLNYPRSPAWEQPAVGLSGEPINAHSSRWHPWANVFSPVVFDGVVVSNTNGVNTYVSHPQPILSDIDFDDKGAMILGFIDRTGHQLGDFNTDPSNSAKSVNTIVGGDILRAGQCTPGVWTLENGGSICGEVASAKQANGHGPGGGEFYYDELLAPAHYETAQGGIAVLPGSGEVTTIAMDPTAFYSGGIIRLSNTTGKQPRAGFTIYSGGRGSGLFSKANGLGDLTILCNPAPLQIGNRVWRDDNRDGIQDPCEPSIPGAVVKLYDATKTTVLASVTTNAAGEYYFSSTTITAGTSTSSVATSLLVYNNTYGLVITSLGTSSVVTAAALSLTDVSPVTPGESGAINSGTTLANNDAKVDAGLPCIKLTTGGPGDVNHTYDFGLAPQPCVKPELAAIPSQTICQGDAFAFPLSSSFVSGTAVSLQWYFTDATSTSQTIIAGATSLTFTPTTVQQPAAGQTRYYMLVAQNGIGVACSDVVTASLTSKPIQTITFTAPASATTTVCANTTLNLSVSTNAVAPDQIRFVSFTSPLASAADAYTATDGNVFGTVNSTTVVGAKTLTLSNVQLPDNVGADDVPLYVYAILVSADGLCQPVAQRVVVLKPRPVTSIAGEPEICRGTTTVLVADGPAGTTFQWFLNNGTTAVSTANPFTTPVINTTATYRVRTTFNACVSDDAEITLTPVTCTPCTSGTGTVGGIVFRDFDSDGLKDANDLNMGDITVTIFRCDANGGSVQVAQMQTDIKGQYSFTGLTGGTDYRVEFSSFPAGYETTYRGTNNGTTIQFTKPGSCSISLGLNQPYDFCQQNPQLATSCYVNGATNATGPTDVLVSFAYNNSGATPAPTHLANKNEIGATWGLAYNRYSKRLYTATFLKRQIGIKDADGNGTADLGVIYITNPATATNQVWADLAKAPYNLNVGFIGTDAQRGLGAPTSTTVDADAYGKVGKAGLGDLEISDDGTALWTVNLNTKTLHKIAINTDGTAGAMTTYALPDPCGPAPTKLFINVGGTLQTGGFINGWNADGYLVVGTAFASGQAGLPYSSGRFGARVAYRLPVANGSYTVKLYYGNNGAIRNQVTRVESTSLTQTLAANTSTTQTATVSVTDGSLEVEVLGVAPGNVAVLSGIEITPNDGQVFSETAPFALKYKDKALYVGITCTAEFSQDKANDLTSTVYRLPDDGSTTLTPVLTVPLDYVKGPSYFNCAGASGWYPWSNFEQTATCATYPTPMLADIEFDVDGSMILGYMDRYAHQVGPGSYNLAGTATSNAISGGDILRASYQNGVYNLETNGRAGTLSGGVGNNQGPGGGEFYSGDRIVTDIVAHQETGQGGLAMLPGSGQIASINMDPVDGTSAQYGSGGVVFFSNTNGTKQRAYRIYSYLLAQGTLVKANGLGDLEIFCDLAPIQIGNRVWRDDNRNGIQDPCEPPIAGAVVKLYDAAKTTVLASVTTNAAGEYYFSSGTVVAGTSTSSVATSLLAYNTTYGLVITSLGTSTVVTSQGLLLTDVSPVTPGESGTLNSGTTQINNDAKVDAGLPCIKLTTGGPGESNHTYDFGIAKVVCSLTATASASSQTLTSGQPVTLTAQVSPAGSYTYVWVGSGTITPTNAATVTVSNLPTGVNTFTVTVSSSPICFTTATVSVTVVPCALSLSVTPGACNTLTNQYTVSGTVSLTATPAGSLTITDGLVSTVVMVVANQPSAAFSLSGLVSGTGLHTVLVTASNLSCGVASMTYTAPVACTVCSLSATAQAVSATICVGQPATVFATVSPAGSYTYSWAGSVGVIITGGSSATATITSLTTAGLNTFTVTVSSSPSCSTTATVSVLVNSPTILPVLTPLQVCAGNNISFGISLNPGDAAYWTTPANTTVNSATVSITNATVTNTGNYTLTYTNANGCVSTAVRSLTVNALPTLAIAPNGIGCTNGGASYSVVLTTTNVSSLTANAPGATLSSPAPNSYLLIVPNTVASFGVSATSTAGCVALLPISGPQCQTTCPPLSATAVASSSSLCAGGTVVLSALTAPVGSYSYVWSAPQGVTLTGANTATATSTTLAGGIYTFALTVISQPGCFTSAQVSITVAQPTTLPVFNPLALCVGNGVSFAINPEPGATVYWTTPANTTVSSATVTIVNATLTNGGVYTLYYTNASGCASLPASQTLTVNPQPNAGADQLLVCGAFSGSPTSTTLTATSATSGQWSAAEGNPASTTFSAANSLNTSVNGLTVPGAYTFVFTSPGSCSDVVTVTVPPCVVLAVTVNTPICNTLTNNYTTTGTVSLTNSPAGSLTITDNGTTIAVVSVTAGQTSASFSVSGVSGSSPAAHTVVASLATATASTSYATPASCTVCSLSATASAAVTICAGQSATLTATVLGGTAGYSYGWQPSATLSGANTATAIAAPTATTTYSVIVTDAKNCTALATVTVTVNGVPTIVNLVRGACIGNTTSVTANASLTGAGTLEYSFNGGVSFQPGNTTTITANGPTLVTVIVRTAGSSCSVTGSITVDCACQTPATVSLLPASPATCSQTPVSLTASVGGGATSATLTSSGTGTFTNALVTGLNAVSYTPSLADVTAGSVTLTITSADPDGVGSCLPVVQSRVLTINPLPLVTLPSLTICAGQSATLTATGSANSYTFAPAGGVQTGATYVVLLTQTTVYSVTGATGNCTSTASATVTVGVTPSFTASSNSTTVCSGQLLSFLTLVQAGSNTTYSVHATLADAEANANRINPQQSFSISATTVYYIRGREQTSNCITIQSLTLTPVNCFASLGDYVWLDTNKNGQQDSGETGVVSVTVTLCDAVSGSAISTTLTDGTGFYLFPNLNPGSYVVKFTAPAGTTFTIPNSSSATPATDSNVASVTGQRGTTAPVSLTAGENNLTIDAGLIPVPAPPSLTVLVSTPICNSVTNTYIATGSVSLSNTPANSTLTITDNGVIVSSQSLTAGQPSASFSVSGGSNASSHTVVATLANGVTVSSGTSYTAPVSCTLCSLSITTSALASARVGVAYSQSVSASGGTGSLTFTATGSLPAGLTLSSAGVISGTPTASGTASFTIRVVDTKNCSTFVLLTITSICPSFSLSVSSATICAGQTATLTASGAATYQWSQGGNTATILISASVTAAYSVTGFSSAGCAAVASTSVVVNGQPQINSISQSTACVGNVASLTVNSTNTGAGVLEYSLNGGGFQTANSFTINAATSATAVIVVRTQGSSCTATESVVVNCACATPVSLTFVPTALKTCAGSPVSFTVGVSGASSASLSSSGTGVFSQSVVSGQTTVSYQPSVADATAGSVTLTLRSADPDGVGACVSDQVMRVLTTSPIPSISVTSASICEGQTAMLMASGADTYRWSNGATTASISVSVAGTYSVTGVSAAGCSSSVVSGSLTVYARPTVALRRRFDATTNTAVFTLLGCVGGTVNWSTGAMNTSAISVTVPATMGVTYSATCTVGSGCSQDVSLRFDRSPGQPDELVVNNAVVCNGTSATLTAVGCLNGSLLWNTNATTARIVVPGQTASYTVTCTDTNGELIAVGSVSAISAASLTLTASPSPTVTVGQSVSLTALGCVGGRLSWSSGTTGTTSVVMPALGSTLYSVTCTTAEGCVSTASIGVEAGGEPVLVLSKVVSKSRAKLGEVISYTITLMNTGPVSATSVVVSESYTAGLTMVPGSASVSLGSFTPGFNGGQWAMSSLPSGATATLTFSASLTQEGIQYNTASIPGQTVMVCTTVPVPVCKGVAFALTLTAAPGHNRYQWYFTAAGSTTTLVVYDGTLNSFTATQAGDYQVVVDNGLGNVCPVDGCCPVVIEEVEVPLFAGLVKHPTCLGTEPQANGEIKLVNLGIGTYYYQISPGTSFSATTAIPVSPQVVPSDGVVGRGLAGGNYTIRVYMLVAGQPSCPRDVTVALVGNCACPAEICIPLLIRKSKSLK